MKEGGEADSDNASSISEEEGDNALMESGEAHSGNVSSILEAVVEETNMNSERMTVEEDDSKGTRSPKAKKRRRKEKVTGREEIEKVNREEKNRKMYAVSICKK